MRTCLVTGAAGFIGSHLSRRLVADGWHVIGVDGFTDSYDPSEKLARAAELTRDRRFRLVAGDLADLPLDGLVRRAEVVFHLAGRPGVRPSFRLGGQYHHDNVVATSRLIAAAQGSPAVRRIVYASSSSLYGNAPLPFREDAPVAPISPYGRTKLAAERAILAANHERLETVALRYFTVYGPDQRPDLALRRFAEAALRGLPLQVLGDGTQSRDFTYVDDIVEATVLAASAPVTGLAVNVGGGSRVSLLEVIDLLAELTGRPVRVNHAPVARGDVRHTEADLARARELLGFRSRVAFADGYAREVAWVRERLGDTVPGHARSVRSSRPSRQLERVA